MTWWAAQRKRSCTGHHAQDIDMALARLLLIQHDTFGVCAFTTGATSQPINNYSTDPPPVCERELVQQQLVLTVHSSVSNSANTGFSKTLFQPVMASLM